MVSTPPYSSRRPGIHRHRVGVVQEAGAAFGDLADIAAEVEDHRDVALAVEDAAGADRVADALVDAVFERDLDVVPVGLQPADPRAVDDVAGAIQRRAAVGGGGNPGRQAAGFDHPLEDLADHRQVVLADVGQRELNVTEFRDAENVSDEFPGEAEAARANDGDPEDRHRSSPDRSIRPGPLKSCPAAKGEFDSHRKLIDVSMSV